MQRLSRVAVSALIAFSCTATLAIARPLVVLKLTGTVAERAADGSSKTVPIDKSTTLKPGERITWNIAATNNGDTAAAHLVPQGRIPAGTTYVAGSASTANVTRVEFSLDGGKTWSATPTIAIKAADGTTQTRKADPSTYTQIRWITDKSLAPKMSERFAYEVKVK